MSTKSATELTLIYGAVTLGKNARIGAFCEIGVPPHGTQDGALNTTIGDDSVIRSHTVIYAGNQIGSNFQTGHGVLIRELNKIGRHVSVGSHTVIEHHVEISDYVRIHSQAFIPEFSILHEGCWIGPNVVFTNAPHPQCPNAKNCLRGPVIQCGAKIGANATLLPGVEIGEMALVGAGAVVSKDVPPGVVVAGNPARVIKNVNELTCPFDLFEGEYGPAYGTYRSRGES